MKILNVIKNAKLTVKITMFFMFFIFLSSIMTSIISFNQSKVLLEKVLLDNLDNVAQLKADKITLLFETLEPSLKYVKSFEGLKTYLSNKKDDLNSDEKRRNLEVKVKNFQKDYKYDNIEVISTEGTIVYDSYISGGENKIGRSFKYKDILKGENSLEKVIISPVFKSKDKYYVYLMTSVGRNDNSVLGYIACKYELSEVFNSILDYTGLGKTGETLLGELRGNDVLFLNPLRHDPTAALNRKVSLGSDKAIPIQEAVQGLSGNGIDIDYRKKKVVSSWVYIPKLKWGLVAKIDVAETFRPVYDLQYRIYIISFIKLIVAMLIAFSFSKTIVLPIKKLEIALLKLGKGTLPEHIKYQSKDEIGLMINATNKLVDSLGSTAIFAKKIGENKLETEFIPLGDEDILGGALLNMRDKLKAAKEFEHERNWIAEGLAQFADTLRSNNDDLELLSSNIIINLVKYLGANQGGLFVINEDKSPKVLELTAMYAYNRKKYLEKEFEIGEGLIGQCWQEGEKIYLTDIPDNYVNVTSGLGEANPTFILLLPLKINEKIYGVIEIASFSKLEDYKIEFIEKLAESIASTISSSKTNLQTTYLLHESKEMTEELRAQEEEMRQNMEEMLATQEEMERSQREMENSQREMEIQRFALDSSAIVSETDQKGIITSVNNSFCLIAEYNAKELVGKNHNIIRHSDMPKAIFEEMWTTISRGDIWKGRIKNKKKSGGCYWVDATIVPIIGDDGNPKKYIGVLFDITDQVNKEEEITIKLKTLQNQKETLDLTEIEIKENLKNSKDDLESLKAEIEMLNAQIRRKDKIINNLKD